MNSPQWHQDEEWRQRVIRQAVLLGFSAYEYFLFDNGEDRNSRWGFRFDGIRREGYTTLYGAAFDYMRLMKIPPHIIGEYRG